MDPKLICPKGKIFVQAIKLARAGNVSSAIEILTTSPMGARDLVLHRNSILENLNQMRKESMQKTANTWSLQDFPAIPTWDKTKTLIIYGPSNSGKTSLSKALLETALFVRHKDLLRTFDSAIHNGIIFDDMNFLQAGWPRESQIHLVDTADDTAIHCRYAPAYIPAGTPRIITTNLLPWQVLDLTDIAIQRRCQVWYMPANDCIQEVSAEPPEYAKAPGYTSSSNELRQRQGQVFNTM